MGTREVIPALPAGFELEKADAGTPPLPPGFELEGEAPKAAAAPPPPAPAPAQPAAPATTLPVVLPRGEQAPGDYYDPMTGQVAGGGAPAESVSVFDRPTRNPAGDGALSADYIAKVRDRIAAVPPHQRLATLRTIAANEPGVTGRAARSILADVTRENVPTQDTPADERDAAMLAKIPVGPTPQGTKPAAAKVARFPDITPTYTDEDAGTTPEQIAARRSMATDLGASRATQMADKAPDPVLVERARREQFAKEHPHLGGLASGAATSVAGIVNAPAAAADWLNSLMVNPVAGAVGAPKLARAANIPGVDYFARAAAEYMPPVGSQGMAKAWDNSQFVPWLTVNMAAQAPQMAQQLIAAMAPPLRALILPGMGAQTAGNQYQQGDSGSASLAKGVIEAGSELLPLHVFDKAKELILKLPVSVRGGVVAEAGKRLLASGAAITAAHLTEGLEEVASQWGQNIVDRLAGKNTPLAEGLAENFVLGAAMGGAMSAPHVVAIMVGPKHAAKVYGDAAEKGFNVDPPLTTDTADVQRKKTTGIFEGLAAQVGIGKEAVKRAVAAAEGLPLAKVGAFYRRFVDALDRRGAVGDRIDPHMADTLEAGPIEPPPEEGKAPAPSPQAEAVSKIAELLGKAPAPATLDEAAHEAATSPNNDLPEPTPAQIEAGNYKKGHYRIGGLDVSIENPEGSTRRSKPDAETPWESTIAKAHYGYILGTTGDDGEHIDTFVKPNTPQAFDGTAFVIDQVDPATGKHDEHKVMLGYGDLMEARAAYRANYPKGWQGIGKITAVPMAGLKTWLAGDTAGPFHERAANAPQPDVAKPAAAAPVPAPGGSDQPGGSGRTAGPAAAAVPGEPGGRNAAAAGVSSTAPGVVGDVGGGAAPVARVVAHAGIGPRTTPIELRTNADGTLGVWWDRYPVLDFESAEPVTLPADATNAQAMEAIRASQAFRGKLKISKVQPEPAAGAPPAPTTGEGHATDQVPEQGGAGQEHQDRNGARQAAEAGGGDRTEHPTPGAGQAAVPGQQAEVAAAPAATTDRRTDTAARKRVAEMTPDELRAALHTDELTGLRNGRWMNEHKGDYSHVVAFDADSLKWVNDNMGHASGDLLLQAWGEALRAAAPATGTRKGGDEFFALANSEQEGAAIAAEVRRILDAAVITAETPTGETVTITGVGVSFGIGTDEGKADARLTEHKAARQAAGERAGRGEQPPGTTRKPAQGQQDQVGAGERQDVEAAPAPLKPPRPEALIEVRKRRAVLKALRLCLKG